LGRDLADAAEAIAEAVQDIRQRARGGNRLSAADGVGDQVLMKGGGGDAGIAEWGVELGIGLRVRFHQAVDSLDQFGVVVFGLVPPTGREVVETADARAPFAQTRRDGGATPAEELFRASWFRVAVLDRHLGLELTPPKAGQFARGGKDDVLQRGRQVGVHERVLVREGATSESLVATK
jgi:hypothetical protein